MKEVRAFSIDLSVLDDVRKMAHVENRSVSNMVETMLRSALGMEAAPKAAPERSEERNRRTARPAKRGTPP